jgi:hypothetical protein
MKPIKFSTIHARILSPALAASAMVFTMTMAQAGSPAATAPAEPAVAANWITFTIGGAFVSGDDANFSRRMRTDDDFYGGIRDMYYSHALNDSTTLTLDGHALPGNDDYEFNMDLEKADLGYIKAGYKQYRTWYDNSGGYSPLAGNRWVQMGNDDCSIDRGTLYLEAGLRMENLPEITFRYTHSMRDGNKDSLAWGDNATATSLKLVPSLWSIDESVDIFELDIEHTIGKTDLGLGLVYERSDYSNTRTTPRGGSNSNAGGTGALGYSKVALTDGAETDLFASHVYGVTRFSDTAWLSYSAAYTTSNSDLNGSRTYDYGTNLGVRDYQFPTLNGGSQLDQFIANVNFMWVPMPDLTVTPSIRYEHETVDVSSRFNAYSPVDLDKNGTLTNIEMYNATTIFWKGPQAYTSATEKDSTTMAVDLRYTGISDVVLYANAMAGFEDETITRVVTPQPTEWLGSESEVNEQEFKVGANWYAMSNLSFSVQGLYESRDQDLDHAIGPFTSNTNTLLPASVRAAITDIANNPGWTTAQRNARINAIPPADLQASLAITNSAGMANNLRPIMVSHETDLTNINLRATWRPMSNLSLVTRYDYRQTQYENQGISLSTAGLPTIFAQIQSGEVESHILSESVTWSPLSNLYVQGFVSWVSSETGTPVSATTPNSDSDYLTCGVSVGYAIDSKTSLTANYNYYGSSDYSVAAASMGYGLETEEHAISLTLSRVINENMVWDLSYGFVTSNTTDTDQSGGYNDFDAHMVSTGLQIRF